MSETKKKNTIGSTILAVVFPAICCGGPLLILLALAYGGTLTGVLQDNALLIIVGLAALGAGAILFLSRRSRRGRRKESRLPGSHIFKG